MSFFLLLFLHSKVRERLLLGRNQGEGQGGPARGALARAGRRGEEGAPPRAGSLPAGRGRWGGAGRLPGGGGAHSFIMKECCSDAAAGAERTGTGTHTAGGGCGRTERGRGCLAVPAERLGLRLPPRGPDLAVPSAVVTRGWEGERPGPKRPPAPAEAAREPHRGPQRSGPRAHPAQALAASSEAALSGIWGPRGRSASAAAPSHSVLVSEATHARPAIPHPSPAACWTRSSAPLLSCEQRTKPCCHGSTPKKGHRH